VPTAIGFKRLGLAIGTVVALGVGGIALSSSLISATTARDAVTAQIKAVTGLEPVVRGSANISIFPPDTITLTDVVLGEDRKAPALAAQVLTARLRLLPLLMGRIEIADVVLGRPRITVRTEKGSQQTNWSALLATLARATKPDAEHSVLSFSEIHISDGTIAIDDGERNIRETLRHVEMSLAWPSISRTFAATGQFAWRDQVVEAGLTVGDFNAALRGDSSSLKFRLSAAPLKVAFDGNISSKPTVRIDGTLAADSARLRDTLGWIGAGTPPGSGFGRFALKAAINAFDGTFALSNVNLELDGNTAEGVLSYSNSDRNLLQGTLAAGNIDMTPYVSTFRLLASSAREWDRAPLSLGGMRKLDVDVRMSAAQVAIGGAKLGRTAMAANLRSGKLVVTIGESQAYGGLITGSFALAAEPGEPSAEVKSQMHFANVDLGSCLAQLFDLKHVDGRGHLSFSLEANGSSIDALTRTLAGTVSLTSIDGALTGLNIEQLLRRLERRPLSGTGDFRTGRTPYDRFNVALKIADGVAAADDIRLDSPAVKLRVQGTTSVPTRDLDLSGTATLIGTDGEQNFELPFIVRGSWDLPLILPDAQSLIRRSGSAAPLLDAVRDRSAREAVRSAIDRLTGAAPPPAGNPNP